MSEFFWFILGAAVYKIAATIIDIDRKGEFIRDTKITALLLIGKAYEQLVYTTSLKYKTILENNLDEEKIKLLENEDEIFLEEWKRKAISNLSTAIPPMYKSYYDIKDWTTLINLLDTYYKTEQQGRYRESETKNQQGIAGS